MGPYWPPERAILERGYGALAFPFEPIAVPAIDMMVEWKLADLVGYLRTWSAVQAFQKVHGEDPVDALAPKLRDAWGDPNRCRSVQWPLDMRVGRQVSGST